MKRLALIILSIMLAVAPALAEETPEKDRSVQDIIEELVVYYGNYGSEAEGKTAELLEELYAADPVQGAKWESILQLWKSVNAGPEINENVLPDGLPETDELCMVVLGFQLNPDGTMTDELMQRLEVAKASAEKYPNALIVCTGGGTATENPEATEAGEMAKWLIENGVDPQRVIVEDQSLTTAQNAIYTRQILTEQYPQVKQLAIISSDYHIATGILLFGAEETLQAGEAGKEIMKVVSNAAWHAPSGTLSTMFQAGALIELSGDVETAFDIYYETYDIHELPALKEPSVQTLIAADNHWALLAVLFAATAIAIWLEQKFKWASKISGAIITLVIALILVNAHVIPDSAPVFDDIVWGYAVPLAIPLLLLQTNIRKIWKETGRFLLIFLIGAVGTVAGTVLATLLLGGAVKGLPGAAAMMTGSYIGGGVNFTAIADAFHVDSSLISATTVADNLNMALYFLVLLGIAGSAFFRKRYSHPHIDEVASKGKGDTETLAKQYWTRKNVSLKDIAVDLAYAAIIVFLSRLIGNFFAGLIPKDNWFTQMLNTFFGSQYVWITNFSVIFATFFHKQADEMHGAQELGTWLIYLFFFVIGVPASIGVLLRNAPILLVFCMIIVLVNMAFCFLGGRLLKFDLEDIILASNANIGGPTTAAGMAISQGWAKLIGPCMLVGTFGYVIGTWLGILVGSLLGA